MLRQLDTAFISETPHFPIIETYANFTCKILFPRDASYTIVEGLDIQEENKATLKAYRV